MSMPEQAAFSEGDLVEAVFPGGGWRPAKVKAVDDALVVICFTGNSTRHSLPLKKVRPRPGAQRRSKPEPAAEVIDLTVEDAEDNDDVNALADELRSNVIMEVASRPSFSHAFGGSNVPPITPTPKSGDHRQPIAALDVYAEHPIARPPHIPLVAKDPYVNLRNMQPAPQANTLYDLHHHAPSSDFQHRSLPYDALYERNPYHQDYRLSDLDRRHDAYYRNYRDERRKGRSRLYLNSDIYHDGRMSISPEEDGYEPEADEEIELPPTPTEEAVREQQHIGIHPELASMRIPRKTSGKHIGSRRSTREEDDDWGSPRRNEGDERHPRTWAVMRQSHMTVPGSSAAEKYARREAAKKRTSPKSSRRRPPAALSRSETVSEVSDEETLSSSEDNILETPQVLGHQRKSKRPADVPSRDTHKRTKLKHLSTMTQDVVASGSRPPPLRTNKGRIVAGKKKPRTQPPPSIEVIEVDSSTTSRRGHRRNLNLHAVPKNSTSTDGPLVLTRRGSGRRKSEPFRNAGLLAIAIAHEIDERVKTDFREYDESVNQNFDGHVFEDFQVGPKSPSSTRFFSCTCDPKSAVERTGKVIRCALCARYSHLWCTGLGRGDLQQLNDGALTCKAQFVCIQCTEAVADRKPPLGSPFPTSRDTSTRLIVPPIAFPLFEGIRLCSVSRALLITNLLNNPKPRQQITVLSEEEKRLMERNVELLRAGVLPRSVHRTPVTKLLAYE